MLFFLFPLYNAFKLYTPNGTANAGLVLLQGAQIKVDQYEDLVLSIQKTFPGSLQVVIPELPFDAPIPADIPIVGSFGAIQDAMDVLKASLPKDAPIYLAGHSLGGVAALEYSMKHPVSGLILMGSTVLRKYYNQLPDIPILTLNGQMDGQFKPMRSAETFYHLDSGKYPVVMLSFVTHMGFANYDHIPWLVKQSDLKPVLSIEKCHLKISQVVSDFMVSNSEMSPSLVEKAQRAMTNNVLDASKYFEPMLKAMELEGSYRLKKPCNSDTPSPHCPFYPVYPPQDKHKAASTDTSCGCGSPFSAKAQEIMAHLPKGISLVTTDAFHRVSEIKPVHLPNIWNNCTSLPCVLNSTTVTENVYDFIDEKIDAGKTYVSASEMRMKLKSRQSFIATRDTNAHLLNIEETDPNSLCREINEYSYELGLSLVPFWIRRSYDLFGMKMTFADDYVPAIPAGPLWINSGLTYVEKTVNGSKVLEVTSTGFKTPLDTPFSVFSDFVAGYHYCKILSPARVVEWVYTDSLRPKLGYSK